MEDTYLVYDNSNYTIGIMTLDEMDKAMSKNEGLYFNFIVVGDSGRLIVGDKITRNNVYDYEV